MSVRSKIAGEAMSVGFAWTPTLIAATAAVALILPQYYDKSFARALAAVCGADAGGFLGRIHVDAVLLFQFALPLAMVYAMRLRPGQFGFGLGDWRLGLRICAVFIVLYIPCFIVLMANDAFRDFYAPVARRFVSWPQFFAVQAPMILVLALRTEFFFRGFIQSGIGRTYGAYAGILAQLVPYGMVHVGKAPIEALGSLPVGLALGYLAWRTGSFWYGLVLHGGIALLFNTLIAWQALHAH